MKSDSEIYYNIYDFTQIPKQVDGMNGVITVKPEYALKNGDVVCEIPPLHVNSGALTLEVSHESDVDFPVRLYDGEELLFEFILPKSRQSSSFDFDAKGDLYNLRADFLYPGEGTVTVKHAYIKGRGLLYTDSVFLAFMIVLSIILLNIYLKRTGEGGQREGRKLLFLTAAFAVFLNYPLYNCFMQYGGDITYHIARIEGTKNSLLHGQFPVNMYNSSKVGRGYLASMYPNLFLYIPAFLRICRVSMLVSYKFFEFLINSCCMATSWHCMKVLSADNRAAFAGMAAYCLLPYRLSCMYFRDALGETQAIVFIPLVIAGMYKIIFAKGRGWIDLTIGMSGVIESHVLSALFCATLCAVLSLAFIRRLIKDRGIISLSLAAAATAFINLWYIVPFLYYYSSDVDVIAHIGVMDFSSASVFPSQLFMLMAGLGEHSSNGIGSGIAGEDSLSLGAATLFLITGALYRLFYRQNTDEAPSQSFCTALFLTGLGFIFMSTTWFPWKALIKFDTINRAVSCLQFPFRFLEVGAPCAVLSSAAICHEVTLKSPKVGKQALEAAVVALAALEGFILMDSFLMDRERIAFRFQRDIADRFYADYVPEGYDRDAFPDSYISGGANISDYEQDFLNIKFSYTAQSDGWAEVPLVFFKGYRARSLDGEELYLSKGNAGALKIALPPSRRNQSVELNYDPPSAFNIALFISAISSAMFVGYAFRARRWRGGVNIP